jgi:Protein of unknown function (DUF1615)
MRLFVFLFFVVLAGCATQQQLPPLADNPSITPPTPAKPVNINQSLKLPTKPADTTTITTPIKINSDTSQAVIARNWIPLIKSWLPNKALDKDGWAQDIYQAFNTQNIQINKENICAAIAVINQESSFQVEPKIPGLPQIVKKELNTRREKYHVPEWILEKALKTTSPDGKTYAQRIKALQTENDINRLFDDMTSELPLGKQLLEGHNPIHTGGPMQVSLKFAQDTVKESPYPFPIKKSLRDELFSRRGGVYFGVAHLLNYPAQYDQIKYRFADFNSGRYASRNAAFQSIVSKLSHQRLDLDGDLLSYKDGQPEVSDLEKSLLKISTSLQMTDQEISRDLTLEKVKVFEETRLYKNIYRLARLKNINGPYAEIPSIKLYSPKITRKLTTAWFAERVGEHYQSCLAM